jgi:hypothetical protein
MPCIREDFSLPAFRDGNRQLLDGLPILPPPAFVKRFP